MYPNIERTHVTAQSLGADFTSEAIDFGNYLFGTIQASWTGHTPGTGVMVIEVSAERGATAKWQQSGGLAGASFLTEADATQAWELTVTSYRYARLRYYQGTGAGGTFSVNYILKGQA